MFTTTFSLLHLRLIYMYFISFFMIIDMTSLVHSSMPICAINPDNRSVTVIVRLMRFMKVRTYEQRKI